MGIKTGKFKRVMYYISLKNLPTTWGLRLTDVSVSPKVRSDSEKPPHHMGIKTQTQKTHLYPIVTSEKPPHHMGIKTRIPL